MAEKSRVILSGAQKQLTNAAASGATQDGDTFNAAVRQHLVGVVGHRNRRPTNAELQTAIDATVSEL